MARTEPSFAGDLDTVQGQVESDVSAILQLAKQQQATAQIEATATESPQPKPRSRRKMRGNSSFSAVSPPATDESLPSKPITQSSPLCNVTTRLTCETNERLTAAALRQRLKKAVPATRQDIIEQAVSEWLERHGYDGAP